MKPRTPGELLPCPFCGGPAKFSIDPPNDECWVACENDHCDVAPAVAGKSPKDAYSGWNRRAAFSEKGVSTNLLNKAYTLIEDRRNAYMHAHGSYDDSTNAWEYGGGQAHEMGFDEGMTEALDIIDALRKDAGL